MKQYLTGNPSHSQNQTVAYFLRRRNPEAPLGYLLSLVGIVGLAVSVWLGGVLVYEERVGVAEDIPSLPRATPPGPGMR